MVKCPKCGYNLDVYFKKWKMYSPLTRTYVAILQYICPKCGHKFRKAKKIRV